MVIGGKVKSDMIAMIKKKPYVKVVINLEYKIIMRKFAQDVTETTQRLPEQRRVC